MPVILPPETELKELKCKIEVGIEEADKGELVSGEEFFAEMIENHQASRKPCKGDIQ